MTAESPIAAGTPPDFRLARRNIVCFSTADWDTLLPTNKHQLMRRLARRNRVLFIETLGTRSPRLGSGTDVARIARRLQRGLGGAVRREPHLWTFSPIVRPAWNNAAARLANRLAFQAQAGRTLGRFTKPIAWVYSPYAVHLLDIVQPRLVVYHMVDDLAAVPGADVKSLRASENELLSRADCVFCTERSLHDRARAINPRARFMPNVADYAHFSRPRHVADARLAMVRSLSRPRIIFSGHIAPHKIDLELLVSIARDRPSWNIILIGPVWEGSDPTPALELLRRLPNTHLLGHVPYEDLPAYLLEGDVLTIPYVKNDATRAIFPLKFFEYLATGRPVVSSPLPSLLPYDRAVRFADDATRWIHELERAMHDPHALQLQRRRLAQRHTWSVRLKEMEQEIGRALAEQRS